MPSHAITPPTAATTGRSSRTVHVALWIALGALAAFVAWGRARRAPIVPRG